MTAGGVRGPVMRPVREPMAYLAAEYIAPPWASSAAWPALLEQAAGGMHVMQTLNKYIDTTCGGGRVHSQPVLSCEQTEK